MTGYGLHIFPQHADLLEASAISPEVARQRGYVSVDTMTRLEPHGFAKSQRIVPGLLIPLHGTDGTVRLHQYRPDNARIGSDGKPRKYETPWRSTLCLDVPPGALPAIADPDVPLWITEGSRKADAAVTAGLCCIALLGVDGWQSKGVALPDWKDVRLKDRETLIAYDSDVMTKDGVAASLDRLTTWLDYRGAKVRHVMLPAREDGGKIGLDDYMADGHTAAELRELGREPAPAVSRVQPAQRPAEPARQRPAERDGAALLDDVLGVLGRYVVFPSPEAADAVALYAAATYAQHKLQFAPRLNIRSPVKRCGKTLLLDVLAKLVHRPLISVDISAAALVRSVGSEPPTIILDEADAIFGKGLKGDEKAEHLRGILNAGFGRDRPYIRWDAAARKTESCPTFAMAIIAGIGSMPDTVEDRSVIITLRRKASHERVQKYRLRRDRPAVELLGERLAAWIEPHAEQLGDAEPTMPAGLNDRAEDVWEALLAVADLAGGDWPKRARAAAVALCADAEDEAAESMRLLGDLRAVFGDADRLSTATVCERLAKVEEAPWADYYGKPIDARALAKLLRSYGVRSKVIRIGDLTPRGYDRADLYDAWQRYLPGGVSATSATPQQGRSEDGECCTVANASATPQQGQLSDQDCCTVAAVADTPPERHCAVCGEPLDPVLAELGDTTHPNCDDAREAGQ